MKKEKKLSKPFLMIKKLKNLLEKDYQNVSFNLENWGEILDDSCNVSVFCLESTVNYYVAYYQGYNLSFILQEDNKLIGLFPLMLHQENGEWIISSNGAGILPPIFVNNIARKVKKRLEKQLADILSTVTAELNIKKFILLEHSYQLSSWYQFWIDKAKRQFLTYQLGIDLSQDVENIRLDFRKSYKPLVNKALKEWDVKIHENNIDGIFEEFRLLHLQVAGKKTRNQKSWDIQKEQIKKGEAFLVSVKDKKKMIGAGLFNYSKDMGMYSVGAYKRELFDKPIGHAVQMVAIEKLKELGCSIYFLGQKSTHLDNKLPSDKELSISYFKEGFAGFVYIQPHLEVCSNE